MFRIFCTHKASNPDLWCGSTNPDLWCGSTNPDLWCGSTKPFHQPILTSVFPCVIF